METGASAMGEQRERGKDRALSGMSVGSDEHGEDGRRGFAGQ